MALGAFLFPVPETGMLFAQPGIFQLNLPSMAGPQDSSERTPVT
jgi:hypothetical protein